MNWNETNWTALTYYRSVQFSSVLSLCRRLNCPAVVAASPTLNTTCPTPSQAVGSDRAVLSSAATRRIDRGAMWVACRRTAWCSIDNSSITTTTRTYRALASRIQLVISPRTARWEEEMRLMKLMMTRISRRDMLDRQSPRTLKTQKWNLTDLKMSDVWGKWLK